MRTHINETPKPALLALCVCARVCVLGESTGERWMPHTKGQ